MCQLLGICSNRAVDIHFSFREWRHRGSTENPHGYGFAWWEGDALRLVKAASELFRATEEDVAEVKAAHSRIFVAHVRLKSVGPQDGVNTHPFRARLGAREFVFAHNGTVRSYQALLLRHLQPEGATDSEHAFLWLLEQLEDTPEAEFSRQLQRHADSVRGRGGFNFLLSDGRTLWAYADNSLYWIERRPPYGGELVRLIDDGDAISLAQVKRPDERAVLVATEPLSDEPGWQKLNPGELLVIRDGCVAARLAPRDRADSELERPARAGS